MAAIVIAGGKSPIVLPASQPGSPGATGPSGLSADGYATRSAMALRSSPAVGDGVYLLEAGREGKFVVDLASNWTAAIAADTAHGVFVASTADATKVYRRVLDDHVNPLWFGIVTGTGNGTANSTAMTAIFAALRALATNANSTYQGTIPIRFPAGYFEFASTIDLTDGTFIIEGATAAGPGGLGTVLKFPAGVTGIRVQRYNTSGASSTRTAALGGDCSIIRQLALTGAYSSTESETHGIHLRASAHVENVYIANFEGDGVYAHVSAGSGGATEGNANQSRLYNLHIGGCRNGLNIDGADVNIWTVMSLLTGANRRWGVWDSSFLGNSYFGCQSDSNGLVPGVSASVVSQSGNRYCVKNGQETGASTNAPSGTTADNTWWYYMGAGGVSAPNNIPAWTSGATYRSGGAYLADDSGNATNLFSGCYIEGGQGLAQLVKPTLVLGGAMSPSVRGVACLRNNGTAIESDGDLNAVGNITAGGNLSFSGLLNFLVSGVAQGFIQISSNLVNMVFGSAAAFKFTAQFVGDVAKFDKTGLTLFGNMAVTGSNTAAPASGTYIAGNVVFNSAPSAGGKVGWVCVTGGTPGTWKPFGAIDA